MIVSKRKAVKERLVMLEIIVLRGCPASGKSSWAKELVSKDPLKYIVVNKDMIRLMANYERFTKENEYLIHQIYLSIVETAISNNRNLIIDNTNIPSKNFNELCEIAKASNKDIDIYEVSFYVPLAEIIERDNKREAKVGEEVLRRFWKQSGGEKCKDYIPFKASFRKDDHKTIDSVSEEELKSDFLSKEHIYIVDIDGTVADHSHRSPYDTEKCLDDKPIINVVSTVIDLFLQKNKIIFVSGRMEKFRELTEKWLDIHIDIPYQLYMRKTDDVRPDQIIKKEIYEQEIKDKYYTSGVFDDRPRVIRMWRELGLTVFQMNEKEF